MTPLVALAACALAVLVAAPGAGASRQLKLGILDDARVFGESDDAFSQLAVLEPQVLRVQLWWKDVARTRPAAPADHEDPAYDWSAYDAVALRADALGIELLVTIVGTPGWANGRRAWNLPPSDYGSLRAFAQAAAKRYDGTVRPRVRMWTAWNEPNWGYFLRPPSWRRGQYTRAIAHVYSRICNAIVRGVHAGQPQAGEKVACGVTAPRAGVPPLAFLRAIKAAGARFDVYAHHPHPARQSSPPGARPQTNNWIALGNIDVLQRELRRLYGWRMRLWLTEYGYQTKPPDTYGISVRTQSRYLKEAYAIAKRNPKIDLLVWFLLRDEREISRWQSGLMFDGSVRAGQRKPSFSRFRCLALRRSASLC